MRTITLCASETNPPQSPPQSVTMTPSGINIVDHIRKKLIMFTRNFATDHAINKSDAAILSYRQQSILTIQQHTDDIVATSVTFAELYKNER